MKIVLKIFVILFLFLPAFFTLNVNAGTWKVKVITSEIIPWADCKELKVEKKVWDKSNKVIPRRYKCEVDKWLWPVTEIIWNIIKYFTFIAWLWWVLFIVLNGIMYSMWWVDQSMKDDAKKRITATILGLVLLLVSWIILKLVAPWVYQ